MVTQSVHVPRQQHSAAADEYEGIEEITTTMFADKGIKTRISVTTRDSFDTRSQATSSSHGITSAAGDDDNSIVSSTGCVPASTSSLEQWRTLVANNEHILLPNKEAAVAAAATASAMVTSKKKSVVVKTKEILRNNVFCGIEISSSNKTQCGC